MIELQKVSRGRIGFDRAVKFFEAAKNSVGIKDGVESICMEIEYIIEEIYRQNSYISQIEQEMK